MTAKKTIAIIGATGYTGSELVRILHDHPEVEIVTITSESKAGRPFSAIHPHLSGVCDLELKPMEALGHEEVDLIFLALPHGVSMEYVRDHTDTRTPIIDLSGDFRLGSPATYKEWYGQEHVIPEKVEEAVFGLPELFRREIKESRLIGNPGCYPTTSILPLAPLVKEGLIEPSGIVIDAKSGVTGAGAKAKEITHFPTANENFLVYGLKHHRHTPEIQMAIDKYADDKTRVLFTPHLLPLNRGILATAYGQPRDKVTDKDLRNALEKAYGAEPFIRLVEEPPQIKDVRGSNYCHIFGTYDERTGKVIAISVLDNLVKGAAGQAIQNMNLLLGIEETTGLQTPPLAP